MKRNKSSGGRDTPGLIGAAAIAQMLDCPVSAILQMNRTGAMPQAVEIAGSFKRWRREDIRTWIEADCPKLSRIERNKEGRDHE